MNKQQYTKKHIRLLKVHLEVKVTLIAKADLLDVEQVNKYQKIVVIHIRVSILVILVEVVPRLELQKIIQTAIPSLEVFKSDILTQVDKH